jgi:hypothetical protein
MRTHIISAFPGTGKSAYYANHLATSLDSDSSKFSWITVDGEKIRNPYFPKNYIDHIKENIGKYEFIFVSSHKEVREALLINCLFFYLFYPHYNEKENYIKRYNARNSPEAFINLISNNWNDWINECFDCHIGCKNIQMDCNYLDDEIYFLKKAENDNDIL